MRVALGQQLALLEFAREVRPARGKLERRPRLLHASHQPISVVEHHPGVAELLLEELLAH